MQLPSSPFILLRLVICFVLPGAAQTITGTISGDVTDASGAVVPGATVTVENLGTAEKNEPLPPRQPVASAFRI